MVGSLWKENIRLEMTALADFIILAEDNTDETWAKIDAHLPEYSNMKSFVSWARMNLFDENYALRDLAASILSISETELSQQDIDNLTKLMNEEYGENPYPSFRAALVLAKRLGDERIFVLGEAVRMKIVAFLEDEAVWDIAKKTLEEMY